MEPVSSLSQHSMDPLKPRIHVDTYNAVLQYIDRMRQTPSISGGDGLAAFSDERGLSLRFPYAHEKWMGIIVEQGYAVDPTHPSYTGVDPLTIPAFAEDYTDNRYFVQRALPDMSVNDDFDATLTWRVYEPTERQHKIVTATNIAEAPDTHVLDPGTVVEVKGFRMLFQPASGDPVEIGRYWIDRPVGAGMSFIGVVVACANDAVTGSTFVTVAPLIAATFGFDIDPEAETAVTGVWAGVDPLITVGVHVLVSAVMAVPGTTSIKYSCIPMYSIEPSQMMAPDRECASHFNEPCAPDIALDVCDSF